LGGRSEDACLVRGWSLLSGYLNNEEGSATKVSSSSPSSSSSSPEYHSNGALLVKSSLTILLKIAALSSLRIPHAAFALITT
jgi:hypothetical protein